MVSPFCTRNDSIDLPMERSLKAENMENMTCSRIKSEDNVEHKKVSEIYKIKNEISQFIKTETNCNSESSNDELEGSEDDIDSEYSQMIESNETSNISEVKVEETQIGYEKPNVAVENNKKLKKQAVQCPSCDYVAKNRHRLFYHKRAKHMTEEEKIKCQFCSFKHSFKHYLFIHIKSKHKQLIKTLKDEAMKSGELSTTNKDASTSMSVKHIPIQDEEEEQVNSDDECSSNDNISLQQNAKNSKIQIEESKQQQSSDDDEFIKNFLNIKRIDHSKIQNRNQCDKCGKICKNYYALYSHKQIHKTEEEKLPCPHCEKTFKWKFGLSKHIKKFHDLTYKMIEKRFVCSDCSFITTSQSKFNLHIKQLHTARPFKCDICSKSFTRKRVLKLHSYTHTGIRFECDICSKSFANEDYLRHHKRRHNMEGQNCKYCGKLIKHMERHEQKCLARQN